VPASASARRYASAAFDVASTTGDYDTWLNTLQEFARILQMPSARIIFASPAVPTPEKRAALDKLLPNTPPMVRNFFHILAERDRLAQVPGIAEALRDLINQRRCIITA
jgi:F0F1-type ATP synthase delta subunit